MRVSLLVRKGLLLSRNGSKEKESWNFRKARYTYVSLTCSRASGEGAKFVFEEGGFSSTDGSQHQILVHSTFLFCSCLGFVYFWFVRILASFTRHFEYLVFEGVHRRRHLVCAEVRPGG